jgi:hypothetical protein
MSRKRIGDEALARWFRFDPAAERLKGDAVGGTAGVLEPDAA